MPTLVELPQSFVRLAHSMRGRELGDGERDRVGLSPSLSLGSITKMWVKMEARGIKVIKIQIRLSVALLQIFFFF